MKSTYFNIANIALLAFGIAIFGISLYLFIESGNNTLSHAFILTSFFNMGLALFGLLTHRFDSCTGYNYYSFGVGVLLFMQTMTIMMLGFGYHYILEYIQMIEGGKTAVVKTGHDFIIRSRVAFLVIFSIALVAYSIQFLIARSYYLGLYKQWIINEFQRLHNIDHGDENKLSSSLSSKGKKTQNNSSSEPLIVNLE